jgi:hypothetical protein
MGHNENENCWDTEDEVQGRWKKDKPRWEARVGVYKLEIIRNEDPEIKNQYVACVYDSAGNCFTADCCPTLADAKSICQYSLSKHLKDLLSACVKL